MHKQNWNKRRIALQKQKTLITRWYNYIYIWRFSNELETVHFLNNFAFLKLYLYEGTQTTIIIAWKQMSLNSKSIKQGNL